MRTLHDIKQILLSRPVDLKKNLISADLSSGIDKLSLGSMGYDFISDGRPLNLSYLTEDIKTAIAKQQNVINLLKSPVINKLNITFLINRQNICSKVSPEVVIVVPSAIGNFKRRNKTRAGDRGTYVKDSFGKAVMLFFVGVHNSSDKRSRIDRDLKVRYTKNHSKHFTL